MRRWMIVLLIILGVVILTLIMAFDIPSMHMFEDTIPYCV